RERYQRLQALVDRAFVRPPQEREAFLARACGNDSELLGEATALLRAREITAEPILGPIQSGTLVGAYRIERELGHGGMGSVFLARRADDSYNKYVAVKVIGSGALDPSIQARFLLERQILADLEHPNIARLIDGGALPDGRQYIVIEYVDGIPITN